MNPHRPKLDINSDCACAISMPYRSVRKTPAVQNCPVPPPSLPQSNHLQKVVSRAFTDAGPNRSPIPNMSRRRHPNQVDQWPSDSHLAAATQLRRLCVHLPVIKYPKGHVLFCQGENADAVYYLKTGQIHRSVVTSNGNERLVCVLGPEEFCGEDCLSSQPLHMTSALIIADAELIRIDKKALLCLLHESTVFSDVFTEFLASRALKAEAALISQLGGTVEQRLKQILVSLADVKKSGKGTATILNFNQTMLAAMVGTTRQRTNQFLNKFRKLGMIRYGRGLPVGTIEVSTALLNECEG
jgi:CRP/FNR family transcriptional regulator, cyclic AMP receptor protein